MKNYLKSTPFLNLATEVEGEGRRVIVRVPTLAIPGILDQLPEWKAFNRACGNKWTDVSAYGAAVMSLAYGDMIADGVQPPDDDVMEMHRNVLIWLLHRLGKVGEAEARAKHEMVILKIKPGRGIRGVRVSFNALPGEQIAANDNSSSTTLH